ncbi:MAG TPA: hypothetical protein VNZ26_14875, partial [Vicinamibacterales bacterium]|nr:hypothetical protein [Vicinamibacterales bacterium]
GRWRAFLSLEPIVRCDTRPITLLRTVQTSNPLNTAVNMITRLGRSIMERIHVPTPFTAKQGQYLAFIYYYSKIHGIPPAEADFRRFFRVTPPVVHQMIKTLHARGFIDREPGKARSIRLRLTRAELPDLD